MLRAMGPPHVALLSPAHAIEHDEPAMVAPRPLENAFPPVVGTSDQLSEEVIISCMGETHNSTRR